jgi:hypothetical protein
LGILKSAHLTVYIQLKNFLDEMAKSSLDKNKLKDFLIEKARKFWIKVANQKTEIQKTHSKKTPKACYKKSLLCVSIFCCVLVCQDFLAFFYGLPRFHGFL